MLNNQAVVQLAYELVNRIRNELGSEKSLPVFHKLYGVPRGGIPVAYILAGLIGGAVVVDHPEDATLIVDDIVDSGSTMYQYVNQYPEIPFYSLVNKKERNDDGSVWYVFPWEGSEVNSAEDIPRRLLQFIGEDVTREGLRETPRRFLVAWKYWTGGYAEDPVSILKTFEDGADGIDEMIFVGSIPFVSHCEHHLAQFTGVVHVAYIPNGRIVGLSKIPRLVDIFARRLQVQERLTSQIAQTFQQVVEPLGVGVVIHAEHTCISSRGVKAHGVQTITSKLLGAMLDNSSAKQEFFRLIDMKR